YHAVRDHAACDDQSSGRCGAGADPDGRRRHRRAVRRARRAEDPRRAVAAAPGPAHPRRRPALRRRARAPSRRPLHHPRDRGDGMIARAIIANVLVALLMLLPGGAAQAERLIVSVSNHRVTVTPNYSGEELVLFGSVERDAATPANRNAYDLVVTVLGPRA